MSQTLVLGETIESILAFLEISPRQLTRVVGGSRSAVEDWRRDRPRLPLRPEEQRNLNALIALVQRLDESFTSPEGARLWLNAASGYFGGSRPIEALLEGRIGAVDAALEALDSGVFV